MEWVISTRVRNQNSQRNANLQPFLPSPRCNAYLWPSKNPMPDCFRPICEKVCPVIGPIYPRPDSEEDYRDCDDERRKRQHHCRHDYQTQKPMKELHDQTCFRDRRLSRFPGPKQSKPTSRLPAMNGINLLTSRPEMTPGIPSVNTLRGMGSSAMMLIKPKRACHRDGGRSRHAPRDASCSIPHAVAG